MYEQLKHLRQSLFYCIIYYIIYYIIYCIIYILTPITMNKIWVTRNANQEKTSFLVSLNDGFRRSISFQLILNRGNARGASL